MGQLSPTKINANDKLLRDQPTLSNREVGKKIGVSNVTVGKRRKQITFIITKETIKISVINFIKRFTDAEIYFEKKEKELEELKKKTKSEPLETLAIIKEQRQNQLDLLYMVSKPKVILGMQQLRDGESNDRPELE